MPANSPDPMVMATTGAQLLLPQLTAAAPGAGPLNLAKVDLFENNFTPTPSNVLADFTIPGADWVGYGQKTLGAWGAARVMSDGRVAVINTSLLEFVGPAAGGGPTIYGYMVRSGLGAFPLLYSVKFTAPVPMPNNNSVLDLTVSFIIPNLQ